MKRTPDDPETCGAAPRAREEDGRRGRARRSILSRLLATALGLAAVGVLRADAPPQAGAAPPTLQDRVTLARAEGLFADREVTGELEVEAVFVLQSLSEAGHQQGRLEVLADLSALAERAQEGGTPPADEGWMRLSLVVETRGEGRRVEHAEVAAPGLGHAQVWTFDAAVELPSTLRDAVVVVEEPFTGLWGAAVVEVSDEGLDLPLEASVSVRPGVWSLVGGAEGEGQVADANAGASSGVGAGPEAGSAPAPAGPAGPGPASGSTSTGTPSTGTGPTGTGPASPASASPGARPSEPAAEAARSTVLRILPPRGRHLEGSTRFETLVSDPDITRVVFFLDGQQVAEETREPFDLRVDLAGPDTPQTVRAVAYGADDRWLGEDQLTVNDPGKAFRVRLARVEGRPGVGVLDVEAEVDVPSRARLDRVEIYFNQELAARLTAPPFQARVDASAATGQDFVRAAAYLEDGTQVEDVRLLNAQGVVEAVEVNLVELYVVVTDREGRPVADLGPGDFTVRLGGKPVRLERVTYAEDVPLSLGLVIDTSASMQFIMLETKQAATQFLSQVLSPGDRAFLVDFSTRPRLRQRSTGDLMELVASFQGMRAEGFTALYDAVIFSLLEYSEGPGRRALVMLTDGDDYKSRFGANRAIQYAQRMGVPVYLIVLSQQGGTVDPLLGGRRAPRLSIRGSTRMELEAVTQETGGRLCFADGIDQLPAVYAEIDRELRSQYLLTFYSESELSEEQRRKIDVQVRGRGLEARTVVGAE